MKIIEWILNKSELEKELENLDRDLMLEKSKNAKLKFKLEEIEKIEKVKDNYLETIKKQRLEIKKLKKQLKEKEEIV